MVAARSGNSQQRRRLGDGLEGERKARGRAVARAAAWCGKADRGRGSTWGKSRTSDEVRDRRYYMHA